MKVHANLEELLEDFCIKLDLIEILDMPFIRQEVIEPYVASNSLALGKPEPLVKNKQCDDDFICWKFESRETSAKCSNPCGNGCCIAV